MAEFSVHYRDPATLLNKKLSDAADDWKVTAKNGMPVTEYDLLREIQFSFNTRFGHPDSRWPVIQQALKEVADGKA